jgi:uracil-DNA glycosylase
MKLDQLFPHSWREFLNLPENFFLEIESKIGAGPINPVKEKIFRAFEIAPKDVRVVIIGQDPYPKPIDAVGLAFSVPPDARNIPASLRNIKKELENDLGIPFSNSGDLTPWSKQGVMLLNRILTAKSNEPLSHKNIGWEDFTTIVIDHLSQREVIFILWGRVAQSLSARIPAHQKILGVHPSPLSASRGFFGSKPFSKCNRALKLAGLQEINWKI